MRTFSLLAGGGGGEGTKREGRTLREKLGRVEREKEREREGKNLSLSLFSPHQQPFVFHWLVIPPPLLLHSSTPPHNSQCFLLALLGILCLAGEREREREREGEALFLPPLSLYYTYTLLQFSTLYGIVGNREEES